MLHEIGQPDPGSARSGAGIPGQDIPVSHPLLAVLLRPMSAGSIRLNTCPHLTAEI